MEFINIQIGMQAQAMAYLDNAKAVPTVWQLCVERFSGCAYAEVKFWCLQTLHDCVKARHASCPPEEQQQVRFGRRRRCTCDENGDRGGSQSGDTTPPPLL
jgi:hypothetical protein